MKIVALFSVVACLLSLTAGKPLKDDIINVNGGKACAACTVLVALVEQLAEVNNRTVTHMVSQLCNYLPGHYTTLCNIIVHIWGPAVIEKVNRRETPDVVCYSLGICHVDPGQQYCHLFPEPKSGMELAIQMSRSQSIVMPFFHYSFVERLSSACELPGISYVCKEIEKVFDKREPFIDIDKDRFSIIETFRGNAWRGRDCNDVDEMIYPGRRPNNKDMFFDSNCNGIFGLNEKSGKSFEEELCEGTSSKGLIYIGDSLGAHFHFPSEWMTAQQMTIEIFKNFSFVLENDLDWPQTSFPTGFLNNTWPIMTGYTDSLYLRLRQRNLCNHRDFQNICFNGANSESMLPILNTIARNSHDDKPAIVFYGMMGNDICKHWMSSIDDLPTPEEFRKNVEATLDTLDAILPNGSHVMLIGLVNGSFIYETMHKRLHPLGKLHKNLYYEQMYEWFNCMRIGPCYGWMNKNQTFRDATTQRAVELSKVLQNIPASNNYKTFSTHFIQNPIHKVLDEWQRQGNELWTLLEPVDSLHPVQETLPLITQAVWEEIEEKYPEVLGDVNPNNPIIQSIFGDQGGH